jgi:broad specificity phosphatase PhoE
MEGVKRADRRPEAPRFSPTAGNRGGARQLGTLRCVNRLILARHGESTYSARGLVNGDISVDVRLTGEGEDQAHSLGRLLAGGQPDLCVTSELARARATAEIALGGNAPVEIWPDLNEPGAGRFEGLPLAAYQAWAWTTGSVEPAPGGGESRLAVVTRYARAYRALLERPEPTILVVVHALPIAYVLSALEGIAPAARMDRAVDYARPYPLEAADLRRALEVLEGWSRGPTW